MHFLNKEQKLIARIKGLLGGDGKFIGDDCAVLPGGLLATTDMLVEDTHFRLNWTTIENLGWKAMAVNLSDIAAMAGKPQYALIAISATEEFYNSKEMFSLYEGLHACAQKYNTLIVGGDITHGSKLTISITLLGQAHPAGVLMRSGAKPGDVIIVTGDFGASYGGLKSLQNGLNKRRESGKTANSKGDIKADQYCLKRFLKPLPKLEESWNLVEKIGTRGALMDTSDGLADALLQISAASGVGMRIDLDNVPIDKNTRELAEQLDIDVIEMALYGGEDYELVACLSEAEWLSWEKEKPTVAKSFKKIGTVSEGNDVQLTFGNERVYRLDPERIFKHIS